MKIIGLDIGEKRIGVARADSNTRIAVPVGFILNDESVWDEIGRLSRVQSTNWFVLGLPRSNEGNETKQSLFVRQFAKTLAEKVPEVKVRFQDESLTSVVAEERLKARKKPYEKGDIDAEAATIILQDFMESFRAEDKVKQVGDRVQEASKKAHGRRKGAIFAIIAAVLVAGVAGAIAFANWYREDQARQRAEYYAALEAEMKAEVFNFTITPGETIFDVKEHLKTVKRSEELIGYPEEEIEAAFAMDYHMDFLQKDKGLEGYLYGETYEFYADATVEEILRKFLEGMGWVIYSNDLDAKYAAQGLTLYEGITLASVVQKEAWPAEMPTVAQVFLRRLAYGTPLGSDVTVSYALDVVDPGRNIYQDNQAALTVDSCYNTRRYAGLPCGPISNPGLSALLAVAEPADTEYLYFLTGDDGLMYYSYTEYEHNQNAYLHCQTLCNVSL